MRSAMSAVKMPRLNLGERLSQHIAHKRYARHKQGWRDGIWEIRQNNIFILPNRHGFYMGFLVLAGFGMGYKVQNNFILLAVIFLFLILMLSLIASVRNLQGLRVGVQVAPYYFAGCPHYIRLNFTKSRTAFGVILACNGHRQRLDLSQAASTICVPVGNFRRGVYPLGALKLSTSFPFGIATSWVWIIPPTASNHGSTYANSQIIICPEPVEYPINRYKRGAPIAADIDNAPACQQSAKAGDSADDIGDLRAYQPDDPPKRIDWKHFAATRKILVRERNEPAQGALILTQPVGELEAGLSYLAGGLRVAEKHGLPAYMRLNGAHYRIYDQATRQQAYHALARV